MTNEWATASQAIGVGFHNADKTQKAAGQSAAGVRTSDAAYASAANDFPRFERQLIRATFDEGILSGAKQPHPELLRRYPNREIPQKPPTGASGQERQRLDTTRPVTGVSGRSGASGRSSRSSSASLRSAAVSIASRPPTGYFRQVPVPADSYVTTSSYIGAGGHVGKEPQPGRETWMLGRGGGQISSFDSSLVHKGHHVPFISS